MEKNTSMFVNQCTLVSDLLNTGTGNTYFTTCICSRLTTAHNLKGILLLKVN